MLIVQLANECNEPFEIVWRTQWKFQCNFCEYIICIVVAAAVVVVGATSSGIFRPSYTTHSQLPSHSVVYIYIESFFLTHIHWHNVDKMCMQMGTLHIYLLTSEPYNNLLCVYYTPQRCANIQILSENKSAEKAIFLPPFSRCSILLLHFCSLFAKSISWTQGRGSFDWRESTIHREKSVAKKAAYFPSLGTTTTICINQTVWRGNGDWFYVLIVFFCLIFTLHLHSFYPNSPFAIYCLLSIHLHDHVFATWKAP